MKRTMWLLFTLLFVAVWAGVAIGGQPYCPGCSGTANAVDMQALGAPACSGPGYGALVPGCCECPPSCCDHVWDGYCEEKARRKAWLHSLCHPKCVVPVTVTYLPPKCGECDAKATAADRPVVQEQSLRPAPQPPAEKPSN